MQADRQLVRSSPCEASGSGEPRLDRDRTSTLRATSRPALPPEAEVTTQGLHHLTPASSSNGNIQHDTLGETEPPAEGNVLFRTYQHGLQIEHRLGVPHHGLQLLQPVLQPPLRSEHHAGQGLLRLGGEGRHL